MDRGCDFPSPFAVTVASSQISFSLHASFFPTKQGVCITATSILNLSNRKLVAPSFPSPCPGRMSVMDSAPPSESFDLPQSSMFLRIAALGTLDPLHCSSTLESFQLVGDRRHTGN
ncbi:hypothetical protein V3481_013194 [Fusarium oxysporum f. sp. vasinfectum]